MNLNSFLAEAQSLGEKLETGKQVSSTNRTTEAVGTASRERSSHSFYSFMSPRLAKYTSTSSHLSSLRANRIYSFDCALTSASATLLMQSSVSLRLCENNVAVREDAQDTELTATR